MVNAPDLNDNPMTLLDGHLYKLVGKKPVSCSLEEWIAFMKSAANRIIEQKQVGDLQVSTIFTGMDRHFGNRQKLLFETTVFGLKDNLQPCWRSSTWNQAVKEHRRLVLLLETKGVNALITEIKTSQADMP